MLLKNKNIFGTKELSKDEIDLIFRETDKYKRNNKNDDKKVPILKGRTILNLFFENSTRTKTSFEIAGKRLGADVINMSVATSAMKKGESFMDTAKTLDAMSADLCVIRNSIAGTPMMFAKYISGNVINAGDGTNEHPTQALLDAYTIREKFGSLDGLNVVILGDIVHSRVARSNIYLLQKYNANITLVGPETLLPREFEKFGVKISDNLEEAIKEADVLNILRLQLERQKESYFPTLDEYCYYYGVNEEKLANAKDELLILHPGPMNRGIEIDFDLADSGRQVILDQVENGLALRMALLELILKGSSKNENFA